MNTLYIYFLKQSKNIWKSLSLRIRIEIFILFIIFFTFFVTRAIHLLNTQFLESSSTQFGLSQFALHVIVLVFIISIPMIHLSLIPKQRGIYFYRTLALSKWNVFTLLLFFHIKYQLIGYIIILPLFVAMLFTTNILISGYFLLTVMIYQVLLILFISEISAFEKRKIKILIKYYLPVISLSVLYFGFYYYTDFYWLFDPIVVFTAGIVVLKKWQQAWKDWDYFIKDSDLLLGHKNKIQRQIRYERFNFIPLSKIKALLVKEILNYFRNRKFIRLQIIGILFYLTIVILLSFNATENFVLYSIVITVIYIWQHFSIQFNEKYVKSDTAFFMKTLPFKFYQIWIAKFAAEILFVIIVMVLLNIIYLFKGIILLEIIQSNLIIILFSLIVLSSIINFKIIFFDNNRLAGYAYHFFIVFITVMSANYYLVGPAIAAVLLIYFTYYSHKEFVK